MKRLLSLNLILVLLLGLLPTTALATESSESNSYAEYITIDGTQYDAAATDRISGDGWTYQSNKLTLQNYNAGAIETNVELNIYYDGENTITSETGHGIYSTEFLTLIPVTNNESEGFLSVYAAEGYHAICTEDAIEIWPSALTLVGGGTSALSVASIQYGTRWPHTIKVGDDAESAVEGTYTTQNYFSIELIPCFMTLYGNGGVTEDGEESYRYQVDFTTGTGAYIDLYQQNGLFTKDEKTQLGWGVDADGTGTTYALNNSYTFSNGVYDATLYALWNDTHAEIRTVREYSSGTSSWTSTRSAIVKLGESYTLPSVTRSGYLFDGWRGEDDVLYPANSSLVVTQSATYTAEYTKLDAEICAVSNIQFHDSGAYLTWTKPEASEGDTGNSWRYYIYTSKDGGTSWENYGRTYQNFFYLPNLNLGSYNAFKIETWVNGVSQAAVTTNDIIAKIQVNSTNLSSATVVFGELDEDMNAYPITVSGLTPYTDFFLISKSYRYNSRRGNYSDETGTATIYMSTNEMAAHLADVTAIYAVQEISASSLSDDAKTATITFTNRGDWSYFNEQPADKADKAVSNIRAELKYGAPCLCWDAPTATFDSSVRYCIQLSENNGATWSYNYGVGSRSYQQLKWFDPGVYNAVRVLTLVDNVPVADFIVNDITLSITQVNSSLVPKLVLVPSTSEEGVFTLVMSDAQANTEYIVQITSTESGGGSVGLYTDATGSASEVIGWMGDLMNDSTAQYLMQYTNAYSVSEDQKNASITLVNCGNWSNLSDVVVSSDYFQDDTQKVSDLKFEMEDVLPILTWTAPAEPKDGLTYCVYYSSDGGESWEEIDSTSWTDISLDGLPVGTYNAFKVTSCVGGAEVASVTANLNLTISGATLDAANVIFIKPAEAGGDYSILLTGVTPSTLLRFTLENENSRSRSGRYSDSTGICTITMDNSRMNRYLNISDSTYLVEEYSNSTVNDDGTSASFSISTRGSAVSFDQWTFVDAGYFQDDTQKVSNIRFEQQGTFPQLCWDAPSEAKDSLSYTIYYSADNGSSWNRLYNTTTTSAYLADINTGTYNMFKVASVVDNIEVATVTATLTLISTESSSTATTSVVINPPTEYEEYYQINIGNATANKELFFTLYDATGSVWWRMDTTANDNGNAIAWVYATTFENYYSYKVQEVAGSLSDDGTVATISKINCGSGKLSDAILDSSEGEEGNENLANGTCGDNLTWVLSSDGVLTISGEGAMYDYSYSVSAPWSDYASNILSIVLEEGVTSIGGYTFMNCIYLTKVTIPNGITSIGNLAFWGCTSLTDVNFPESLVSIGDRAFKMCSKLTTLTIPASVTQISERAFARCTSLSEILVDSSNSSYISVDGILFDAAKKTLLCYPAGKTDVSAYEIPAGVTRIGACAFSNSILNSITIADSVSTFGWWTFFGCSNLTSIVIPQSVTNIGGRTFYNCSNLASVYFEGDAPTIGDEGAFIGVVATVYYPSDNETWTDDVMQQYGGTLTWKSSSASGDDTENDDDPDDPEVNVLDAGTCGLVTDTSDGSNVTWKLTSDGMLTISGSGAMANFDPYATPWATYRFSITKVVVADGVTAIGDNAFYDHTLLKEITLGNGVTEIGRYAFTQCYALETITLPVHVTTISSDTFDGCVGLKEILVAEGNTAFTSVDGVLFYADKTTLVRYPAGKSDTEYTIPVGVTSILEHAFSNNDTLTTITIPASVINIAGYAFFDLNLSAYEVDAANSAFTSVDGVLFNANKTQLVQYPSGKSDIEYTIPDTVMIVDHFAFSYSENLIKVTIPANVTAINRLAFDNCSALTDVIFTGDAPTIVERAFNAVNATCYYPAANTTWTNEVMQQYGGTLTWKEYISENEETRVSNLRFALEDGVPCLYWDAPIQTTDDMMYCVAFSSDGGETWAETRNTSDLWLELIDLLPGTYNAIKVITLIDETKVAELLAEDLTLTSAQGITTNDAKMTLIPVESDDYAIYISGLNPNACFLHIMMSEDGTFCGGGITTCGTNGIYVEVRTAEEMQNYFDGTYLICEILSTLSEDNLSMAVTVTNRGQGKMSATIADEKAEVGGEVTDTDAVYGENVTEAEKEQLRDTVADVTVDLNEATKETIELTEEEISSAIGKTGESDPTVNFNVYLDIKVKEYTAPIEIENADNKVLTLDITPMAIPTVKNSETGEEEALGDARLVDTTNIPVVVRIPLPEGFANLSDTLYLIHTKDNGTRFSHQVDVQEDETGLFISFINMNGFSTFSITSNVASVTDADGNVTGYSDLNDAIKAAASLENGGTVTLLADYALEDLLVRSGVTLDLNGWTLTADYVVGFNGSNIVDSSEANTGLLKAPKNNVSLAATNRQIPVWNCSDGYRFFAINKISTQLKANSDGSKTLGHLTYFEADALEYLAEGKKNSGVSVVVRLNWSADTYDGSQDFVYTDATVQTVVNSYNSTTGKYGQVYTASFAEVWLNSAENMTAKVVIISDTGVEYSSNALSVGE